MAFEAARKRVRSQGKLARRQWLEARIDEANQAAQHHDQAEVYRMVNTLAPRKPRTSVYIKSPEGTCLVAQINSRPSTTTIAKRLAAPRTLYARKILPGPGNLRC